MVVGRYSVVIPAYNAAAFIGDALRSIFAQTVPPERVIVVDDGSTDDTAGAVAAMAGNIDYVRQDNAGPGSATTRGMNMVETAYLAMLDADDLWLPDKIERQFKLMTPDVTGVFGRITNFRDDPANAVPEAAYDGWLRGTMLIRTAAAQATGPVIDPVGAGDMVDWLARVREGGHKLVMLPELVALRRVHGASMTAQGRDKISKGYLSVARAAMLRRRAAAARDEDKQ